jgi:hypothetical protein
MKIVESLIIGHVTKDKNIDYDGKTENAIGGAVYYSSISAFNTGHNIVAFTKSKSQNDVTGLKIDNIIWLPSKNTTLMENRYIDSSRETRESKCTSVADQFSATEIIDTVNKIKPKIVHFAGLLNGDYEFESFLEVSKILPKPLIAIDTQGLVRNRDSKTNKMFYADYSEKQKIFPLVDFLKTDFKEAQILTGSNDLKTAALRLHQFGAKEILITHSNGALIYNGDKFYNEQFNSKSQIGRTGRGDTVFASYICERLNRPITESLKFATAVVSLKMEKPGGFSGNRNIVDKFVTEKY